MSTGNRTWLTLLARYGWAYAVSDLALDAMAWAYKRPALGSWLFRHGYAQRLHTWVADVTDRVFPDERCPRA